MIIDSTHAYALSVGGFFVFLLLLNARSCIKASFAFAHRLALRHLVYPQLIRRNRYTVTFHRADILVQILFLAANAFCLGYRAPSIRVAGMRAAYLSLTNLIPAFAGPHLSFLADLFGVSLHTFRRIHRSAGIMSFLLLLFHIVTVTVIRIPFPLDVAQNMWGLVGASSLSLLLLLSCPLFRQPSYEVFLRVHQTLAVLSVFSTWRHVELESFFPRLGVYILVTAFLSMFLLQSMCFLYQNKAMGASLPQAYIFRDGDAVKVRLRLSRHVKVKAGQYVGLWIPAISFWSSLQSHPFTVTSWSAGKQQYLDLLIEPRKGWTQKLLDLGKVNEKLLGKEAGTEATEDGIAFDGLQSHLALFSGPHGPSVPVSDCETVVMVASGFGIASQLAYLKQLVYGYNACQTRNRRIHLVWQLETDHQIFAVGPLLNAILRDDTLDDGYILGISIYVALGAKHEVPLGRRVDIYYGTAPDLKKIITAEREGKYINRVQEETGKQEDMAVLVSATGVIRDQVRDLVRGYAEDKVTLFELEYQPA